MASLSGISGSAGAQRSAQEPDGETSGHPEMIVAGDFCIDLETRQATVRGQLLRLTDEEFEMLIFLVGHPRSIVKPHTRLSAQSGYSPGPQADFLRVLTQLRNKLRAHGCAQCVRTELWLVYQFDPHARDDVH